MNDSNYTTKIMFALIAIAVVSFILRSADMGTDLNVFKIMGDKPAAEGQFDGQVNAQSGTSDVVSFALTSLDAAPVSDNLARIEPAAGDAKKDAKKNADKMADKAASANDGDTNTAPNADADLPEWRDASDTDITALTVKQEVFDELNARRKTIESREKDLKMREAFLKAAEQELEQKYGEMTTLREELEVLLGRQTDEEKSRIASLVKVYENMKPKDAARIFDTLDLDILIDVMGQMSERKLSPVLASMNDERARTVTIMLAEQKKLPEGSGQI